MTINNTADANVLAAQNVLAGTSPAMDATTAQNFSSAADYVANTTPPPPPQPQAPAKKPSLMADIFHAIGEVLGGPSTQKRVNPQTGVIEEVPLSRSGRIANTVGIYARGAAAGAAQHGPGAVGKAALAGSQEQQQTQQQQTENTLAESKNVQAQLEGQASRALLAQQTADIGWRMQREGTEIDEGTADRFNTMQSLISENPLNKDLGHYPTFSDMLKAHPELQQGGISIPQLLSQGKIRAVVTTENGKSTGIQVYEVNPDWEKQKTDHEVKVKVPDGMDDKGNVKYVLRVIPPGSISNGKELDYLGSSGKESMSASERAKQLKTQSQLAASEESKNYAEAHKAILESGVKGDEEMIDKGRNPYNGTQLSISNAPDSMMVDSTGRPIPFKMLSSMKPSQSELNRADFAGSVMHMLDSVDKLKAAGKLPNGPLTGISKQALASVGLGDADAQKAINEISLIQSASTGAHVGGRFSVPVLQKMQGLLQLRMNDSQFQGAEDSIRDVMQRYVDTGGRHTVAQWKEDHAITASAPGKPKQVSYDGGKTWQTLGQ